VVFGSVMLGCQTKLLHFDAPVDPMLLFAPGITRRIDFYGHIRPFRN
jgi:hypothetical protein